MQSLNNNSRKRMILLREMKNREYLAEQKLNKLEKRIKILESFISNNNVNKCSLGDFMQKNNLPIKKYFAPIGYYLGEDKVVSNDLENTNLSYHKGMAFNKRAGYHLPIREIVKDNDHKEVTQSEIGMIFSPRLKVYLPKKILNSDSYLKAEGSGDIGLDIMGGMTVEQLSKLRNENCTDRDLALFIKDLFEDEYDNVSKEYDVILGAKNKLSGNYSSADGERKVESGKNLACRTKCNTIHPFNKSKREKCQKNCDEKFKASQVQEERRRERDARNEAKKDFREDKKDCKRKFRSGELTRSQYKECIRKEKEEKKEILKEEGGRGLTRVFRTFAKIFPLTAGARGSALVLIGENMFGIATKLAPAVLDEAKSKELFKTSSIEKSKQAYKKVLKAWLNIGGQKLPFENAIKKGWNKRVKRHGTGDKKSSMNGIRYEPFSNAEPITTSAILTLGTSVLTTLTAVINKSGADKNPYKEGKAPEGFNDDLKNMDEGIPPLDPKLPQVDPKTGKWIEQSTGKEVDPLTGQYKNEIFGINKWLVIGIGVVGLMGIYFLTKTNKPKI